VTARRLLLALAWAALSNDALAQAPAGPAVPAPTRSSAANALPNAPPPPLQPEPGDVWAEVRGWDAAHRKRMGLTEEPAKPAPKPANAKPARRRQ